MDVLIYSFLTVFAWGTWLSFSQKIPFSGEEIKIFYVAAANLLLAAIVGFFQGFQGLNTGTFWFPFLGGLIWALSGYFAFLGTNRLGIARATGIWAPLNILVSIVWGVLLFGEFLTLDFSGIVILLLSLIAILSGILLIILSQKQKRDKQVSKAYIRTGLLGALGAGILWGSYFIPIQISDISMWVAAFPLAVGIFSGSLIIALISRKPFGLNKPSHYVRVFISGLLWGFGNYTSLALMEIVGTGKGFTIAQLNIVINSLLGIILFKEINVKTPTGWRVIGGIILATLGGIILGNLKG